MIFAMDLHFKSMTCSHHTQRHYKLSLIMMNWKLSTQLELSLKSTSWGAYSHWEMLDLALDLFSKAINLLGVVKHEDIKDEQTGIDCFLAPFVNDLKKLYCEGVTACDTK